MIEYIIRFSLPEDKKNIIEYLKQIGKESENLTFGGEGIEVQNQPIKGLSLIAENIDGDIVGTLTMPISDRKKIAHRAAFGISVLKKYQRQGIGSALIEEMFAYAKNSGIKIIDLDVLKSNTEAIRLYEKKGFIRTGEIKMMLFTSKGYEDGWYYQKLLFDK